MAQLWRRFFIAWCPALLVLLWMAGRWVAPDAVTFSLNVAGVSVSVPVVTLGMPMVALLIGLLFLFGRARRQKAQRREMVSAFARVFASLAVTETRLSVPLLLTVIALLGSLGDSLEKNNLGLLLGVVLWLAFTVCMVLLLEPLPSPEATPQEGRPPQTRGLVLFLSRKPPSPEGRRRWEILKEQTKNSASSSLPWEELKKRLPEILRARRGEAQQQGANPPSSLPSSTPWLEALSDTPLAPPLYAIAYHRPKLEHLWVVSTTQTEDTLNLLGDILGYVEKSSPGRAWKKLNVHKMELKDPSSLPAIQEAVNAAYREAERWGLPESEVTTDITGGSTLMGVGGVLTCVRSQRRVQYLNQTTYELQEVPVGVDNVAEAIQELLEQLPQLMRKGTERG